MRHWDKDRAPQANNPNETLNPNKGDTPMRSKKLLPIAGMSVFLLLTAAWAAQAQNLRVAVMNVRTCTCDASAEEVNTILGEMPGVMDVEVNIQRHMVTVTFDEDRVSLQEMKEKLAKNDHRVHGKVRFLQ